MKVRYRGVRLKHVISEAGVAQGKCNRLPRDGRGSIPGGNGVKTEHHIIHKGQ